LGKLLGLAVGVGAGSWYDHLGDVMLGIQAWGFFFAVYWFIGKRGVVWFD
jgi:hypothetical protein